MKRLLLFALVLIAFCRGTDFTVRITWNEMEGDVLGIIQYVQSGSIEEIKGYANSHSADGNITVPSGISDGTVSFLIKSTRGGQFNLWLLNPFMDDDFVEPDSNPFAKANVRVKILNHITGNETVISIPGNQKGLVFYVGTINDGKFIPVKKMYATMRLYRVNIVNALDGAPLPGAVVSISKPGLNTPLATGMTDREGDFSTQLDYGKYSVSFSRDNFISINQFVTISLSGLPVFSTIALAPESKKFRIVLTWGATPVDLDAHLTGPKPEGGTFHIWYNQKTLISGKNFLDRDDMQSYGPETITIYKPASGEYRYVVHDYSDRLAKHSTALSYSGAKVDIYADNQLQKQFSITSGKTGNVWEVFIIDEHHKIIPVNQYRSVLSSKNVFR